MCKPPLKKNECALFDFKKSGRYNFWNKNVSFPISLLFCDENFNVKQISYLKENQLNPVYSSNFNIRYVVESHHMVPMEMDIKVGDRINIKEYEVIFDDRDS